MTITPAGIPTTELGYQVDDPWNLSDDENNPKLRWPQNVRVYSSMRTDAQVASTLRAVTLPILRTEWAVDGMGCKARVTKMIAEDLGLGVLGKPNRAGQRTRDRFDFGSHLELAMLELVFGHSVFEQSYRIDEAGFARLAKLGWRPPATIAKWNVARDGGLVSVEQKAGGLVNNSGPGDGLFTVYNSGGMPVQIPVDRLVVYSHQREGGNWPGRSLLRTAYGPWMLKNEMVRVQAVAGTRNGLGIPLYVGAEIPEAAGLTGDAWLKAREADIAAGLEIAKKWQAGEQAGGAVPHGADLKLVGVSGKVMDLAEVIRYYDEQIARSVLAHFLTLGTQTGSWALGTTFADFFTLSLQTIAAQIATIINQHVIEDLVDLNFGPNEPAPRVVWQEIGSQHPATAEAIAALVACGALSPDETLETHIRTMYGLPEVDPATVRQGPADPATTADPATNNDEEVTE